MASSHYNFTLHILTYRWSDQGAFTGDMTSIHLRFQHNGVRWFDGKKINKDYKDEMFGYLFQNTSDDSDSSDEESDQREMYQSI